MDMSSSERHIYLAALVMTSFTIGTARIPRSVLATRPLLAALAGSALFTIGLWIPAAMLAQDKGSVAFTGLFVSVSVVTFGLTFCAIVIASWVARRIASGISYVSTFNREDSIRLLNMADGAKAWVVKRHEERVLALANRLRAHYTYLSSATVGSYRAFIGMNGEGSSLFVARFRSKFGYYSDLRTEKLNIEDIVSVELIKNSVTRIMATTAMRKKGTFTRAAVGTLVLGPVGAVVGASSAQSIGTTTGTERQVFESCDLVIGTTAISNPVLRFRFVIEADGEAWFHRLQAVIENERRREVGFDRPT